MSDRLLEKLFAPSLDVFSDWSTGLFPSAFSFPESALPLSIGNTDSGNVLALIGYLAIK